MPKTEHELDAPPWQRVESTLMATSRAIRHAYDAHFAPLELNLTQASLLVFLHEFGPERQSQLATRLGIGRAAAGSLIDQLEKRGLLERLPDPADRRAWHVTLTTPGEALVEPVRAIDRDVRSALREDISPAERRQLARLLLRLQENVKRVLAK